MEWSKEWPSKPGWYWFYGQQFKGEENELKAVEVFISGSNKPVVSAGSHFIFKSEVGDCRWLPIEKPSLPTL